MARSKATAVVVLSSLVLIAVLFYMWRTGHGSFKTASSHSLEQAMTAIEVATLMDRIHTLEADKRSLGSKVNSLRIELEAIQEEERLLQEQLNVALGKEEEWTTQLDSCKHKVESVSSHLSDSKELIDLWNVTLRECQNKLRRYT